MTSRGRLHASCRATLAIRALPQSACLATPPKYSPRSSITTATHAWLHVRPVPFGSAGRSYAPLATPTARSVLYLWLIALSAFRIVRIIDW